MRLLPAGGTRYARTGSADETNAANENFSEQDARVIYRQFLIICTLCSLTPTRNITARIHSNYHDNLLLYNNPIHPRYHRSHPQ